MRDPDGRIRDIGWRYIQLARQRHYHEGFNDDQLHEIGLGIAHNVDVSLYANREFYASQMWIIRLGLEEGVDVTSYAKPEYSCFKMEEMLIEILDS